jgi:acetoin utilization deacetylase AcuC-like enzyme
LERRATAKQVDCGRSGAEGNTEPMRKIGLVTDERFRAHQTGAMHPECPERLEVLDALFASQRYAAWPRVAVRPAGEDELGRVHTPTHIAAVASSAGRVHTEFDADTLASAGSFEAARLAAGGAIALADAIVGGELDAGFAALRPPGHHAEADHPMGFCLFNNVAIVARHLQAVHGLDRVLIVDWDVHHGNGTQHSFYDDPNVMYVSMHQYPFYPGTGAAQDIGRSAGEGTTVNLPMLTGTGGDVYDAAMREVVLPMARSFDPQFVLVSAGFDAHRDDPLASLHLDTATFARMTDALVDLAAETCAGRLALLLEGGYDLDALRNSVAAVLDRLESPQAPDLDDGELGQWGQEALAALTSRGVRKI